MRKSRRILSDAMALVLVLQGAWCAEVLKADNRPNEKDHGVTASQDLAKETKAKEITQAGSTNANPPLVNSEGQPVLKDVIEHLNDLYRSDSSVSVMTLTVVKPRRTRTMTLKAWTKGQEKALIVIKKPARDSGTATLKVGKNLWNYMPRISRTIRIPPSMMLSSWMGSDFTNDDVVRESSLLDDFHGKLTGRADEPKGWKVVLTAQKGTVGLWQRMEYVVSDDGMIPLQAKYYDRKGRLSRIMTFSEVREFDGRKIPTRMELVPVDKEGRKTVMVYDSMKFNVEVPESTFSLTKLEQHR